MIFISRSSHSFDLRCESVCMLQVYFKLLYAGPPSVQLISAVDRCSSFNLMWEATFDSVCGNVSYTVRLLKDGNVVMMDTTMDLDYLFTDLDKSVRYSADVTATNMAGDSNTMILLPERITIKKSGMLYNCFEFVANNF